MISKVSAVSTRDAKGPGDCWSKVFIAEEVGRVGDKGSGDSTVVSLDILMKAILNTGIIFLYC
jgi:hypothetical protein